MAEKIKRCRGWFVPFPFFLRVEPESERDLVTEVDFEGFGFDDDRLYATEQEAWEAAGAHLVEAREQALKDLDFLSKPYFSPDGKTEYIVSQAKLDAWRAEVREELRIAEKGQSLCRPT